MRHTLLRYLLIIAGFSFGLHFLNAQEITDFEVIYNNNLYEITYNMDGLSQGSTYDIYCYAKTENEDWFKLKTIGGDFTKVSPGMKHFIIWEPYFQSKQKANYQFRIYSVDTAILASRKGNYQYEAIEDWGTLGVSSNRIDAVFMFGNVKIDSNKPMLLPVGEYTITAKSTNYPDLYGKIEIKGNLRSSYYAKFPIGYITVQTNDLKGSYTANGILLVPNKAVEVPPGNYKVVGKLPGYSDKEANLDVFDGHNHPINFAFSKFDKLSFLEQRKDYVRSFSGLFKSVSVSYIMNANNSDDDDIDSLSTHSNTPADTPVYKISFPFVAGILIDEKTRAFQNGGMNFYFGGGFFDEMSLLIGKYEGKSKIRLTADYFSVYLGCVKPFFDYKSYIQFNNKLFMGGQGRINPNIKNEQGEKLVLIHDFYKATDDQGKVSWDTIDGIFQYGYEASLSYGIKVAGSRYLTLSWGARYNSDKEGKWYLQSDVDAWNSGHLDHEPQPVEDNGLPTSNFLQGSLSYFLQVKMVLY